MKPLGVHSFAARTEYFDGLCMPIHKDIKVLSTIVPVMVTKKEKSRSLILEVLDARKDVFVGLQMHFFFAIVSVMRNSF